MRTRALLYHDVIPSGSTVEYSGFPGASASAYKLTCAHFQAHLSEVHRAAPRVASIGKTIHELLATARELDGKSGPHVLITFDDGGVSAITHSASYVESLGWRGHFFIATNYVGRPGFLTADQIRELDRRGHVIGSHSCSHPLRMADLSFSELMKEWTESLDVLSAILGRQIDVASVPGGLYSKRVGVAARDAGVKILFTSEPQQRFGAVDEMKLVGRYSIVQHDPAEYAYKLASGAEMTLERQWALWNAKKLVKRVAAKPYGWARELYFNRKA